MTEVERGKRHHELKRCDIEDTTKVSNLDFYSERTDLVIWKVLLISTQSTKRRYKSQRVLIGIKL